MIVAEFMRLVTKEARYVLILTALLVLIILVLSFRNVYACLLALLPFLCGCSIMLGGLVLMDVQLNYFNIVVLPIVFGYGINNAIFLFYRFLESGRISKAVMQTGLAGVASSLTTMAGWAGVVLSDHPGLRSMGLVALPGLSAVMLATTVTLPALLSYTQQHVPLILKNIRSRLHRGRLSDKRSRHFLLYAD
ncbi:MAG: MMPL family transporter [Leptospiraceae bacterium]|nr:MMPL family transporter [Leptospiraceae bacterium]